MSGHFHAPKTHCFARFFLLLILGLILGAGAPSTALAADEIGIYWDAGFTTNEVNVNPVPGMVDGYLVLRNPSTAAGITGWELCVEIDGPGAPMNWTVAGQNINVETPPCFVVGLAEPLLPNGDAILLATFQYFATQLPPVAFRVGPTPSASLPGQMAFVPADRPFDLEPMGTVTGTPEVAWINSNNPWPELSTDRIEFGVVAVGTPVTRSFTVTNAGAGLLNLDIQLNEDCVGFELVGVQGPVTLAGGQSSLVVVKFTPVILGGHTCEVSIGDLMPSVEVWGEGREPIMAYTVSSVRLFGEVPVGDYRDLTSMFRNTGEVPIQISPSLVGCGPEFTIVSGAGTEVILAGGVRLVNVRFQPTVAGPASCALSWSPELDQTPLQGSGREATTSYEVTGSPAYGTTWVGNTLYRNFSVRNTGETVFEVTPTLTGCVGFSLPNGSDPVLLSPGQYASVSVAFAPDAIGAFACDLDLGSVVESVALTGYGREPVLGWEAPTQLNFGTVEIGRWSEQACTIRNTGEMPFVVTPALLGCGSDFVIRVDTGPTELTPGQQRQILVRFEPTAPASVTCQLDLGAIIPPVALMAEAIPPVPSWLLSTTSLVFVTTPLGQARELTITIHNTGLTLLDLDVRLADPNAGFSIVEGAGVWQMAPGDAYSVVVRFAPLVEGDAATDLILGGLLPLVPVSGFSGDFVEACALSLDHLDFGSLMVGNTSNQPFTVTNIGNQPLSLAPVSTSPHFAVTAGGVTLQPGERHVLWVQFQPSIDGVLDAEIRLGTDFCGPVTCTGQADFPSFEGQNQLGIFFDPGYSVNEYTTPSTSVVTGYLVLYNPSSPTGVAGWECRIDKYGPGFMLGWRLEGQALNVSTQPEFTVGIGGAPLPHATAILLASFDVFVLDQYSAELFAVGPTSTASLPGQMAWALPNTYDLVPMFSITDDPIVASINGGSPVAVETPTPVLTVVQNQIQLTWPAPATAGSGSHVYRRSATGGEVRLTTTPLSTTGPTLEFSDNPTGFAPGTKLYYSYALVVGSRELARSPAVEVTLSNLPAARTRLLPNVPNPFNPQTEIRFELARPARTHVAIYDVTGRRVKVLESSHLGVGPHMRVWQGRDDSGRPVSSGAYYVRLTVEGKVDHRKIMLLK